MRKSIKTLRYIPKKKFGQHFLVDSFTIENIVSHIDPLPNQPILEIGPGLGALTKIVVNRVHNMTVVEIDADLVKVLEADISLKGGIDIIQGDVKKINFSELSRKIGKPMRIFGTLPYNSCIPIIFHLFKYYDVIGDMHFAVQKEVAKRMMASSNESSYGRLSVMVQCYCEISSILELVPSSFFPVPEVYSTLIRLIPRSKPFVSMEDIENLSVLTNFAFGQRRKKICNSLKKFFSKKQLIQFDIDPNYRAENLDIESYYRLSRKIREDNVAL